MNFAFTTHILSYYCSIPSTDKLKNQRDTGKPLSTTFFKKLVLRKNQFDFWLKWTCWAIWEITLLKQWKHTKSCVAGLLFFPFFFFFFFPLPLKENNFPGKHSFLFINVKSVNQGQEGSFSNRSFMSFQWNLEPTWGKLVIRICHYNKELYDCQLQIISEVCPHKHVKWRWVGYKSFL